VKRSKPSKEGQKRARGNAVAEQAKAEAKQVTAVVKQARLEKAKQAEAEKALAVFQAKIVESTKKVRQGRKRRRQKAAEDARTAKALK
jgi:hypothetical protein